MYFWIMVIASAVVFSLWMWYELKHAITVEDDGEDKVLNLLKASPDEEHDEAVKAKEAPKIPE